MKARRLPSSSGSRRNGSGPEQKTGSRSRSRSPRPPSGDGTLRRTARQRSGSDMTHESGSRAKSPRNPPLSAKHGPFDAARRQTIRGKQQSEHGKSTVMSEGSTLLKRFSDSDITGRVKCYEVLQSLEAAMPDGKVTRVTLQIEGEHFAPVRDSEERLIHDATDVGQDGNQFYCQVCKGFGEIVCCDGCPRVYHPDCIPLDNPSRLSLERDDDPWFCPQCTIEKQSPSMQQTTSAQGKAGDALGQPSSRRGTKQKCVDCQMNRPDLSLEACQACGSYVHHPSCGSDGGVGVGGLSDAVYCSTCKALDELKADEDHFNEAKERSLETYSKAMAVRVEAVDDNEDIPACQTNDTETGAGEERARRKRKRLTTSTIQDSDEKVKKASKKKRKFRDSSVHTPSSSPGAEMGDFEGPFGQRTEFGPAQATPAFYFYLTENRWKIERALSRGHRIFNRLPKGPQRNALVAQEAAVWWSKLRPAEHRRYINMSMRDYESQILEWKEDKTLQDMGLAAEYPPGKGGDSVALDSADDDQIMYDRHERLYLSTSVGSKPFKPEPDQSYNRVLLDLLHDMRFHPLPLFSVNRSETETVIDDHSAKVTIPFFDVHGPISTSVGDECLGCSRGWLHYCPVLQRRVPAVEHRAKLQAPLSSLMATRVGLGLRPRLERDKLTPEDVKKAEEGAKLFEWRSSEESKELQMLDFLPSASLSNPSDRADNIAHFIEETMAMKVPEPIRPTQPGKISTSAPLTRKLPLQRGKGGESVENHVYKCGRCRTIIYYDTGCIQCRRAQLVINTTKTAPVASSEEAHNLTVRSVMLGRVHVKEGTGDTQSEADVAVSNVMLKERWTPNVILPPQCIEAPHPRGVAGTNDTPGGIPIGYDNDPSGSDQMEDTDASSPKGEDQVVEGNTVDDSTRRPHRLSRGALTFSSTGPTGDDRDRVARENKRKTDELYKKTLSIAICGILLSMKRHDPLLLFAEPATAEGYMSVVKQPIDLGQIRTKFLSGKYASLGSFVSDAKLLCENAISFNPVGSIYAKTAGDLLELVHVMQKRASSWMGAIMDGHTSFLFNEESSKRVYKDEEEGEHDPFENLRGKWSLAVEMLESGDWLRSQLEADFMRTHENETAYYGALAVRRVAAAAEACLAPYTVSGGIHNVVSKRTYLDDAGLRRHVDEKLSSLSEPLELQNISTWREETVVRWLRKVQSRRLDRRSSSENGCSRCGSLELIGEKMMAFNVEFAHPGRSKRKGDGDVPRVDPSRTHLTTGLGSARTCQQIAQRESFDGNGEPFVNEVCVSVRGSKIHGWGLVADQPFKQGDVVAEYLGEYISNAVADLREKAYQEQRIQDYQFRIDDKLVIDATMKGGHARYINHNCTANCYSKIVQGKEPKPHLKRVLIVAQRAIEINEEITYDYQFPLELDLDNRIPCNCQSDACRGFMNWDIPEKGSNNRALLIQKRGANMRDRIRRLGRPLKRDEHNDD